MKRPRFPHRHATKAGALTILLALSGCDAGPPSVTSSKEEATVHGTVTFKNQALTAGTVRFDPTNIRRPDAKVATSPLGKGGTYKITTLVGENSVYVDLPADVIKKNPGLAGFQKQYTVPGGDSTFDIDVPPR